MKRFVLACAMTLITAVCSYAQNDVEYRADFGVGVGATTYYGDFNSNMFSNMQPAFEGLLRLTPNPHMAIRAAATYTQLKGDAKDSKSYFNPIKDLNYKFKTSLVDVSLTYEYNFWAYGTGHEYRGAKRFTPFLSIGLGATYAKNDNNVWDMSERYHEETSSKSVFTANVPIGFGAKYRLGDRMNLSLDWQMHFSLSDQLDGMKDPYAIASEGLFKNTDCYSTLSLALTYSFSAKCSTCMKDRR